MRYSKLFSKTSKNAIADADCVNAKLLTQAGFISKEMSGVYNYLPLGLRVLQKIQNIIREEINAVDGQEILMPVLSSLESWQKTGRDKSMAEILFCLNNLVLNPTHEEVVTPLLQKYIFSYKDLPVAVYQIRDKFRNEPRAKSGLLRGREFNMKDLYSFHTDTAALDKYYDQVADAYKKIFDRLGIGDITYLTFASGGTFSKYSHEFQTVCPTGEDTIYVCEKCKMAVNQELIDPTTGGAKTCPKCNSADLVEKKSIETGNIFKLGTKYSSAFNFNYLDADNKLQPIIMGCYGMGPSRIMGTLVEVFNDEKGIIWPESVAPYQIHLIGLDPKADELYEKLNSDNILYDDRPDVSAGTKFADADLIGIPLRLVVSKKSLESGGVEVKQRSDTEIKIMSIDDVILKYGKTR